MWATVPSFVFVSSCLGINLVLKVLRKGGIQYARFPLHYITLSHCLSLIFCLIGLLILMATNGPLSSCFRPGYPTHNYLHFLNPTSKYYC